MPPPPPGEGRGEGYSPAEEDSGNDAVVDDHSTGLVGHLVALVFAADVPLGLAEAARVLGVRRSVVEAAAGELLERPPLGLILLRDGDHLQLGTAPESAEYVRRLRGLDRPVRLSRAALEVLAVVAYRQPVTRAEIEAIRGVNGDHALSTLLNRGLIDVVGRRETVGRPVLFGTTGGFLEHLGLRSLADLPPESTPETGADADLIAEAGPGGTGGDQAQRLDVEPTQVRSRL